MTLTAVDVLDPSLADAQAKPLAHFAGQQLGDIAQPFNRAADTADADRAIVIGPGQALALFMEATIPQGQAIPRVLRQRLTYADGTIQEGGTVKISSRPLKILGAPVTGGEWTAADGPSNDRDNHHRRGLFVVDSAMTNSRRFAIDWKIMHGNMSYSGESRLDTSYFAFLRPVLAVADAVVVDARDGAPDNPAGHNENFHPAVPVTFDNAGGNMLVLDLGDGQYAHYFHLENGSLAVKIGDHVKRGQVIAKIGASGDAREPHLHFEVSDAVPFMDGQGLPYVIDQYRVVGGDGFKPGTRHQELPQNGMIVEFGGSRP